MEFIGDIAQKTGKSSLLAVEATKAKRAGEIGKVSGLFYVPRVLNFDKKEGKLNFERLTGLITLRELAVKKDTRLFGLLEKTGLALAVVHEQLVLPDEMKYELPSEWMGSTDENVFIHGDFGGLNVCFHEPSGQLVILDWSAAPLMGKTATFGSRYFDILWFASYMFRAAPTRRMVSLNAEGMAHAFIKGYVEATSAKKLNKFKDYRSNICRLQKKNIRHLARQATLKGRVAYLFSQVFMYTRLCVFLHKY